MGFPCWGPLSVCLPTTGLPVDFSGGGSHYSVFGQSPTCEEIVSCRNPYAVYATSQCPSRPGASATVGTVISTITRSLRIGAVCGCIVALLAAGQVEAAQHVYGEAMEVASRAVVEARAAGQEPPSSLWVFLDAGARDLDGSPKTSLSAVPTRLGAQDQRAMNDK